MRGSDPTALPGPARSLAPRVYHYGVDATVLAAAGLAGAGFAPLTHHSVLAIPALGLGCACAAARMTLGIREKARGQMLDRLAESLHTGLGFIKPSRRSVRARKWTQGWPGVPNVVTLRYSAQVGDDDPMWASAICDIVGRRLLATYRISKHDRRRCVLRLRRVTTPASSATAPHRPVLERAELTITELVGPTASIRDDRWSADGELVGFTVHHAAGTKLAASGYRRRVETVVSTMLPGRWRAKWDLEADEARFEVRPTFPTNIWIPTTSVDGQDDDILSSYDSVEIPYAVDEDRHVQVWRPAHDPNLMVVGAPGTGKTTMAHTILVTASQRGWPIWVVDGKSIEFLGFQSWPNVQIVATTIQEQVAVIHRAWEVMEHRYNLIVTGKARESDFEPLLVFLDEFADFRSNLMAWYAEIKVKGDPTKPVVLSRAASISRKGRTSRVHLVFGTQRPDAEYFGGDMRDNFRMRVSTGRLSPQGAMMMFESPSVGTSIPRGCRGRATAINDENRPVEVQTYRTPDPRKAVPDSEEAVLLDRLRPQHSSHDRLLILPPKTELDLDTSEPEVPTYNEYAAAKWVLAADHPELDPVLHRQAYVGGGREAASPMAIFGLASPVVSQRRLPPNTTESSQRRRLEETLGCVRYSPAEPVDDFADAETPGGYGYGPIGNGRPATIRIGDLVLVDEDTGQWATVDEQPEEDYAEPGCIALSWRDDADNCGSLTVPEETLVPLRRPLEEEPA